VEEAERIGAASRGWARTPRGTCTRPVRRGVLLYLSASAFKSPAPSVEVELEGGKTGRRPAISSRYAALTSPAGSGCDARRDVRHANDRAYSHWKTWTRLLARSSRDALLVLPPPPR
jgi:hypothetical protein